MSDNLIGKVESILRRHMPGAERPLVSLRYGGVEIATISVTAGATDACAREIITLIWPEAVERCASYAESMSFDDAPVIAAGIRILATAEPDERKV